MEGIPRGTEGTVGVSTNGLKGAGTGVGSGTEIGIGRLGSGEGSGTTDGMVTGTAVGTANGATGVAVPEQSHVRPPSQPKFCV